MTNETFDWDNKILDMDPSINVVRGIDGEEVRHWDFRRANFVGQRSVRQTLTVSLNQPPEIPSQSFEALHDIEE